MPRPSTSPNTTTCHAPLKKITDYLGADVCIDAVGAEADGGFFHVLTDVKHHWIDAMMLTARYAAIGAVGYGLFSMARSRRQRQLPA